MSTYGVYIHISVLEVNFDNTSITVLESDSEVEICLVLNGSIAQVAMITVETRPKGRYTDIENT